MKESIKAVKVATSQHFINLRTDDHMVDFVENPYTWNLSASAHTQNEGTDVETQVWIGVIGSVRVKNLESKENYS